VKEKSVIQHYNLLPDKMQQNALYVFIVTNVKRQNISPVIFSFFFHIGAGNFLLLLFFLAYLLSQIPVSGYSKLS